MSEDVPEAEMVDQEQAKDAATLFRNFRHTLAAHQGRAVFTVGGTVELENPLTIRWDSNESGAGLKVQLPVPDDAVSQNSFARLVKDCDPATFGRKEEEVYDEEYRKAGKIDTDKFCTDFNPYGHNIIDIVNQSLAHVISVGNHRGLRAELYKLNVYSAPSGRFKPHVDTPRSEEQMGSLVVCLPNPHSGGELAVRHGGQEIVHNWAPASASAKIQWAAFFSDCEHEVLPVTSGHRVTLTYNLFWSTYGPCAMAASNKVLDHHTFPFYKPLHDLLQCSEFFPKGIHDLKNRQVADVNLLMKTSGGILGFTCTHAYPHTSNAAKHDLVTGLKGLDMVMYQALKRFTPNVRVTAVLNDADWREWLHDNEESLISDSGDEKTDDMSWATSKVFLADRPRAPFMWHDFADGDDEPPNPQSFGEYISGKTWKERRYRPWFPQTRVAWLNHKPGPRHANELATAYLTYGNQPGMGTYYSSAVIIATLTAFDGKKKGEQEGKADA